MLLNEEKNLSLENKSTTLLCKLLYVLQPVNVRFVVNKQLIVLQTNPGRGVLLPHLKQYTYKLC